MKPRDVLLLLRGTAGEGGAGGDDSGRVASTGLGVMILLISVRARVVGEEVSVVVALFHSTTIQNTER